MQFAKLTWEYYVSCIFVKQLLFSFIKVYIYFILIIVYGYYLFTFRAPRATIQCTPTTPTLTNIAVISHDMFFKILQNIGDVGNWVAKL